VSHICSCGGVLTCSAVAEVVAESALVNGE
jgi:hypothetical protein